MGDLLELTAHMSRSLEGTPQEEWRFRYNDRYGNLINLEADEDVRLMLEEWNRCNDLCEILASRSVQTPTSSLSTSRPAVDPSYGIRAEIHVTATLARPSYSFTAANVTSILESAIAFGNEFDEPTVGVGGDE